MRVTDWHREWTVPLRSTTLNRRILCLFLSGLSVGAVAVAQSKPSPAAVQGHAKVPRLTHMTPEQQKQMLTTYCGECHNNDARLGNMSLDDFDPAHPEKNFELAEKVLRMTTVKMMPPPGEDRPDDAKMKLFDVSLSSTVDQYASKHTSITNPPLHRLNRTEYQNSVRELLGIEVDAEKLLPPDDMSHGFDNMSDVLTLSPALMEAYVRAAGKISRQAIGDRDAQPLTSTYSVPRVVSQARHVDGAPLGTRGGISVMHDFPADGDYTFKMSFYYSLDGPMFGATQGSTQQIEVSVNGVRAAIFRIKPTMSKFDEMKTPPIHIKAGPQRISAAFLVTGDGPVDDAVEPIGLTLLDLNQAELTGLTTLPHLHELQVTGPAKVDGISETPSRKRLFVCTPTSKEDELPCAKRIITRVASRAYRRPLRQGELEKLIKRYDLGYQERGFEGGIGVALQAVLANPSFIYRFEPLPTTARFQQVSDGYRLEDLGLASRLSYFLWSSAPDETLLKLASSDQLHRPEVLKAQVARMLADPRSNALASNFAGQWLHLQNLKGSQPDGYLYPQYDRSLGQSMRKETELFFSSVIHDDAPVTRLLDANYTYVNEQLARHYGIPNVTGNRFRRVTVTDENRFGLLGHASILTLTSASNRTSPVIRGKYVMEVFLGTPPPPPPPNVPALKEHLEGAGPQTVRARLEEHRKNPTCAGCHKFMDPIGFALENFDPTGAWRKFDSGAPLDSAGNLYDGIKLDGPASLRRALMAHSDAFMNTFAENLFAYGMGRVLVSSDEPTIRAIRREASAKGDRFSAYVLAVVSSNQFQKRSVEASDIKKYMATIPAPAKTAIGRDGAH